MKHNITDAKRRYFKSKYRTMDIDKLKEIVGKLNRSNLLKGMAYEVLDSFIKQSEFAAENNADLGGVSCPEGELVCEGCEHKGTSKWLDPCHTCRNGDLKEQTRAI
jgi:hypothetical protein